MIPNSLGTFETSSPTKSDWKATIDGAINSAINSDVEDTWREDIKNKTTLRYINPNRVRVGQADPVWATVRNSVYNSRRVEVKCRLLKGTYIFQSSKVVSANIMLILHVKSAKMSQNLAECPAFSGDRDHFIKQVRDLMERLLLDVSSPDVLTHLFWTPLYTLRHFF